MCVVTTVHAVCGECSSTVCGVYGTVTVVTVVLSSVGYSLVCAVVQYVTVVSVLVVRYVVCVVQWWLQYSCGECSPECGVCVDSTLATVAQVSEWHGGE